MNRPATSRARDNCGLAGLLKPLSPVQALFWHTRRRPLLLGALLASLTVMAGMALLGLSGWFISATAMAGLSAATALVFDVFMPSSGIRLFTLGRTLARYAERLVTHDATLGVLAELRERLFRAWAGRAGRAGRLAGAARALALRPTRLLFRLTADIDALDSLYLRLLVPAATALVAVGAAALALSFISGWLALAVSVLLLVGSAVIVAGMVRSARRPARLRAHAVEALRARTADLVAGQVDLLMTDRLTAQRRAIVRADAVSARCDARLQRIDSTAALAWGVLGSTVLGLTLLVAGSLVAQGWIGVPVAVLAVLLSLTVTEPFGGLRRGALELGRTLLAARRLGPALGSCEPEVPQVVAAEMTPHAIAIHGLAARHPGAATFCLQDIDLQMAPGERVALVGASGAGKSSLMAVLTGELDVACGSARRAAHGWLTQRTELFQDSLRDNLRLASPEASDDELWQALATAGLAATVRAWPLGLDTALGEGGLGLSGGQARRLALARLLLRPAALWLLDEPTEGLDDATAGDVLARLRGALGGRTLLMATHSQREAALADRIVVLAHGRIAADVRRGDPTYEQALRALRPAGPATALRPSAQPIAVEPRRA